MMVCLFWLIRKEFAVVPNTIDFGKRFLPVLGRRGAEDDDDDINSDLELIVVVVIIGVTRICLRSSSDGLLIFSHVVVC